VERLRVICLAALIWGSLLPDFYHITGRDEKKKKRKATVGKKEVENDVGDGMGRRWGVLSCLVFVTSFTHALFFFCQPLFLSFSSGSFLSSLLLGLYLFFFSLTDY
jgi:hypothetical protein